MHVGVSYPRRLFDFDSGDMLDLIELIASHFEAVFKFLFGCILPRLGIAGRDSQQLFRSVNDGMEIMCQFVFGSVETFYRIHSSFPFEKISCTCPVQAIGGRDAISKACG